MNIRLDEKHAVNPTLEQCFLCLKDMGLVLFGKLTPEQKRMMNEAGLNDPHDPDKAPRQICLGDYCDECKEHMKNGVICISVDEERSTDPQNPYRTGGWCLVRDEAISRIFNDHELRDRILKKRVAFIPDDAWAALGLPR